MRQLVTTLLLLAGAVWVGGVLVIPLVTRAAWQTLPDGLRIAFFQRFGRLYGMVAGVSLVLAFACAGVLLAGHPFDATLIAGCVTAVLLVIATVVGVLQARHMTALRSAAVRAPDQATRSRLTTAGGAATALRAVIAVLTLLLVIEGVLLATT
ncbi:MAG TPA: hypothetical protein VFX33_15545 [Actinomycetales bacterium]|nr:hypothetical protein [Actinomycetales bacterium]